MVSTIFEDVPHINTHDDVPHINYYLGMSRISYIFSEYVPHMIHSLKLPSELSMPLEARRKKMTPDVLDERILVLFGIRCMLCFTKP